MGWRSLLTIGFLLSFSQVNAQYAIRRDVQPVLQNYGNEITPLALSNNLRASNFDNDDVKSKLTTAIQKLALANDVLSNLNTVLNNYVEPAARIAKATSSGQINPYMTDFNEPLARLKVPIVNEVPVGALRVARNLPIAPISRVPNNVQVFGRGVNYQNIPGVSLNIAKIPVNKVPRIPLNRFIRPSVNVLPANGPARYVNNYGNAASWLNNIQRIPVVNRVPYNNIGNVANNFGIVENIQRIPIVNGVRPIVNGFNNIGNIPFNNNVPWNNVRRIPLVNGVPMNNIANIALNNIGNIPVNNIANIPLNNIANIPLNNIVNIPLNSFANIPFNTIRNIPINNIAPGINYLRPPVANIPITTNIAGTPVIPFGNIPIRHVPNSPKYVKRPSINLNNIGNKRINDLVNIPLNRFADLASDTLAKIPRDIYPYDQLTMASSRVNKVVGRVPIIPLNSLAELPVYNGLPVIKVSESVYKLTPVNS